MSIPGGLRIYFSIQTGNRQTEGTREKEQPPRGVAEIFLRTQNKNCLQKISSEQQRKNEEDEKQHSNTDEQLKATPELHITYPRYLQ